MFTKQSGKSVFSEKASPLRYSLLNLDLLVLGKRFQSLVAHENLSIRLSKQITLGRLGYQKIYNKLTTGYVWWPKTNSLVLTTSNYILPFGTAKSAKSSKIFFFLFFKLLIFFPISKPFDFIQYYTCLLRMFLISLN